MRAEIPKKALEACVQAGHKSLYTCHSLKKHLQAECDMLRKWLDADKTVSADGKANDEKQIEKTNARLAAQLAQYLHEIKILAEREQFLEKRLDHAFRAMQRKKLYADTAEGLMAVCENMGLLQDRAVLQMIRCTMGEGIMVIGDTSELDDNSWKVGIDLAMLECEPELADSDELFAFALPRHAGRIFADVMMSAYASKLSQLVSTENYKSAIERPLAEKYMHDASFRNLFSDTVASAVIGALQDIIPEEPEIDPAKLQEALDKANAEIAALRSNMNKAIAPVQACADKLAQQNAGLEQELVRLRSDNNELLNALVERDRQLSACASQAPSPANLPDLPEDNIIFTGGHQNMTKKLRQKHPGWTFIDGQDVNFPEFLKQPEIVFFWDQHISHPTYWRVRKFTHPSVPQAYLKSTNLDMLEAEMKSIYATAKNRPDDNIERGD